MTEALPPICVECRFHRRSTLLLTVDYCQRWVESRREHRDPVTGEVTVTVKQSPCREQRSTIPSGTGKLPPPDLCGPEGRFFEPKPRAKPPRPRR